VGSAPRAWEHHMAPRSLMQATCAHCGQIFTASPSRFARGQQYCSRPCSSVGRRTAVERICQQCGTTFAIWPNQLARDRGQYCSRVCARRGYWHARAGAALAERLWPHVAKGAACWEWTGHRNPDGFGQLRLDGRRIAAHRAAWLLTHGEIPPAMRLRHRCHNPACVRPDHLVLDTPPTRR
jgi:hypothetical protein